MKHFPYIGSGPYCYANSFAMVLGEHAPSTAVIEFATSSPFGMQLVSGKIPFFDPYGWTPSAGFDHAIAAMGWKSTVLIGRDVDDAIARLKAELQKGPVFVGPVEMGHLRYQPGKEGPIGADHYVVVLRIYDEQVELHDPQGYPYASLPLGDFVTAWKAETVDYGAPFTMRTDFQRVQEVSEEEIIKRSIPAAAHWLSMSGAHDVQAGTVGNHEAAKTLADMIEAGCTADLRDHLIHFAVRVGARRAADAASCLSRIGYDSAARIMSNQARLIGSIQHPLVVGDEAAAAAVLRALAPTYEELKMALERDLQAA
ncbi:hypothetical protein DL765_008413 [Monosporascus sp. GIB2]|nr:hypothetical protein DL765_008413 [Monosporascus sp. GIB2]